MVSTGIQYINIKEFTNNVKIDTNNSYYPVTGDGIFDDLMETATKHLTAQYKAGRIRAEDYADLYAHIYEVTLQSALMAWLQKPEQAAKVELLNAQTEHEYIKIDQTKEQTKLIIEQQALTHEQALHETSKRLNTEEQTILIREQQALTHAQALHEASKKLNTEADTVLKESQSINVKSDTELKEKQAKSVAVEPLVKLAQAEYYKAQTKSTNKDEEVKEAQINSENMKSNLYQRQIEGYDENYKEKILKILLDAFTVVFSVASEGFKGGLPKVLTVSGINDLSDIITNDLNIPRTNATISTMTNTSNPTPSNNPLSNHHNTTVPESYSLDKNEWDLNDDTASSSSGSGS